MKDMTYRTALINRAFELATAIRAAYPTVPVSITQVQLEPAEWSVRAGQACGIARETEDGKPMWTWPTAEAEARVAALIRSFGNHPSHRSVA